MEKKDQEGGAGWSGPLLDRSQAVLDSLYGVGPKVAYNPAFAWDENGASQSSPNHETTAWNCEALRATVNQEPKATEKAFKVVLGKYIPQEIGPKPEHKGIWTSEQLCPDNHTHQHLAGVGMCRATAVKSQDRILLQRSGELLTANVALMLALATPETYHILSVGLRCHGKPVWWWGTAFLRQVMGLKPQDKFPEELYLDRAAVGIRAIKWCQEQKDPIFPILQKATDLSLAAKYPLKYEVLIYRGKNSHLVIMPRPEKVNLKNVCDWVLVPHGMKTYKQTVEKTQFGLDWKTEPPKPPAGSELVRIPPVW